jgi:GT2 family glycosyltransferase
MELSIIIVNYRSRNYLNQCLRSIEKHIKKDPFAKMFEVILVNNDKESLFLKENFNFPVKIIQQNINRGFGASNNIGAEEATGSYLFFLNPDTLLSGSGLWKMLEYAKEKRLGAIGPKIILAEENRPQPWTCGKKTNLWKILFKNTLNKPWNRKKITPVDWLSGTALLLERTSFKKVGGFDEKFFMYFEDQDLCLRLKKIGKKNMFYPLYQIIHFDGKSWKEKKEKKASFYASQDYFFSKHNPRWQLFALKQAKSLKEVFSKNT